MQRHNPQTSKFEKAQGFDFKEFRQCPANLSVPKNKIRCFIKQQLVVVSNGSVGHLPNDFEICNWDLAAILRRGEDYSSET
jgi:hypothetical protein